MPTISLDQTKNLLTNLKPGIRIELTKLPNGEVIVLPIFEEMTKTKEQIIQEKYAALMGQPITISEAAKKYDISRATIESWIYRNNYIQEIGNSYPMNVDEADVAYCVDIYRQRKASGMGFRGVPLLDENGLPYELKRRDLAEYRKRKRQN